MPNGETLVLYSGSAETVATSIYYRGWSAGSCELALWYALAESADLVLDVGAHIGHYALTAALANRKCEVHAFEPLPRIADVLRVNVKESNIQNCSTHELAISNKSGSAKFFAVKDGMPSSSSLSEEFMSTAKCAVEAPFVKLATIDSLTFPKGNGVLMKIDTETTEADVILGALCFINKNKPIIFAEVLNKYDADNMLAVALSKLEVAYTYFLLTENGPVKRNEIKADSVWRNYLLIPESGTSLITFSESLVSNGALTKR